MAGRYGSAALLPHRDLVPQEHEVSIRVAKLGAVAPEALPRRADERHACGHEPAVRLLHVVDLEGEDDPLGGDVAGGLVEEQREARVVLQGHRPPAGHLDLQLQAEVADVPGPPRIEVADTDRQVVELAHRRAPPVAPPRTLAPTAASPVESRPSWPRR